MEEYLTAFTFSNLQDNDISNKDLVELSLYSINRYINSNTDDIKDTITTMVYEEYYNGDDSESKDTCLQLIDIIYPAVLYLYEKYKKMYSVLASKHFVINIWIKNDIVIEYAN